MKAHFVNTVQCLMLLALLNSCMVGPDYVRPQATLSYEFREAKGWKQASPNDQVLSDKWWQLFNDALLDELQQQVLTANQSIIQAEARYRLAQHTVQSARSQLLPIVNGTATVNRFRAASGQSVAVSGVRNLFGAAISIAWEPDLWGSVRRQIESGTSNAQASAANLQALRLSLQGTLAEYYFQLRTVDAQKALLDETVTAYTKILDIVKNRYEVGVAAKSDVAQALTQVKSVRARAINLGVERARLEHAIAVLIGKTPATFTIKPKASNAAPPVIPLTVPSELLERRPDIATAERQVAAANAEIGVAKAAYFPTLNLGVSTGAQSSSLDTLFNAAKRYWALGPAGAALTLFDGGAKNAQYKQAIDTFDASVANYRQIVLTGFGEVEDQIAALRVLEEETQVQDEAVAAANQALALTVNQYQAGTVSYQDVIIAQTQSLTNRQVAVQLQGERLVDSVLLIKAMGGGWTTKQLPTPEQAIGETKWTDFLIFPVE
jgi:NodT family efflux transporter outer membrane factor (OMF) lipoprotein